MIDNSLGLPVHTRRDRRLMTVVFRLIKKYLLTYLHTYLLTLIHRLVLQCLTLDMHVFHMFSFSILFISQIYHFSSVFGIDKTLHPSTKSLGSQQFF